MSKVIYCKKCHTKKRVGSYEEAIKGIKKESGYEVVNMCTSSCGLGKKKFFIEIEDELLVANDFYELLKKIKEYDEN